MENSQPQRSTMKMVLTGALVLCAIGMALVGVMGRDETTFQLRRANNVINRWSCPPGGYPGGGKYANCLCVKCPVGNKCVGGSAPPRPCSPGSWQNIRAQSTCKPAQPGHYVPNSGSSTQKKCPPGKYQPASGKRSCIDASKGNYVGKSGATGQTKCPLGKFVDVRGRAACKKCTRGHKCNKVGMSQPSRCHYGKYQDNLGQTSCKQCPPANSCPSTGMTTPTPCGRNTFQHCTGQTNCIPCATGLVAPRGSRSCSSVSNFRAMGCYVDTPKRMLRGKFTSNKKMTTEMCSRLCIGYRYFGTQARAECFCGNKLHKPIKKASGCNLKCAGNKNQICGGAWRNSLYRRT